MKITAKLKRKTTSMYGEPPVTIAFLGDSVTQGCFECYQTGENSLETVYDYEHSIARNLEKQLHIIYPNTQINIINSGISGDSAANGLYRFERDIAPFSPDLVVVGYALNDSGGGEAGLASYSEKLRGIFAKIDALGAEKIFLTPNMMNSSVSPHLPSDYFRGIAERFAERQNSGILDRYSEAGKQTAESCGAVVVDIYARWKAMEAAGVNTTELLANKLNHPIRELNAMTAYEIASAILMK